MSLSPREQQLFDIAKGALPRLLFSSDENDQEILAGMAKLFGAVWDHVEVLVNGTRILQAEDEMLDQHAVDRGTRRQAGESDDALRARLRFQDDAVTPIAIMTLLNEALEADEVVLPSGYPAIVELRRDRAHMQTAGNSTAFFSRGYRMAGIGRAAHVIIVILPLGTSDATVASIVEALRLKKAGGIRVFVEVSEV